MKLKELDALLRLYEQNFRNLHWNSAGLEFNDSHKNITTEYYEMLAEDVDAIAEILCMYGANPVNYVEAYEIIKNTDNNYYIVNSMEKFDKAKIVEISEVMLNDICKLLSEIIPQVTNPLDAGIKSELESMLFKYSKEARYLNKRRAM